ncbi:tellurite resistance TerB family protein [Adhaeribacter aquaticus]|uniref:tellurite resistance TerB family protein n=1 Tax=Adhaeribacter aquaticus TaxID=299567 RepID=UPI0004026690|nr:tellurite resistance TerB family protein [Adhaeribacter aquaticus]
MGVFNESTNLPHITYQPQNEQEAWIAIMHACIAVDEDVAEEELDELAQTLANKELFEGHNILEYYKTVMLAHTQIGSKQLIDNSVDFISPEYKATLFALIIELVLADGRIDEKERELIKYLYSALDMEVDLANKIVEVILIKNKGNGIF